jgi:UDP-glucose 4-epimerase
MKRLLLTGVSGFVGRNVLPILREKGYDVIAPARSELDLLDADAVRRYLKSGQFDAVLHLASPTGHNPLDVPEELFERSVRVFMPLATCSDSYGRMIYIGSGAEYGKHRPLVQVREDSFGKELPRDAYGLSRYAMNELAKGYSNIINLRLFGCYGPGDPKHKLVPSVIEQALKGNTVELRQDCFFDFLYVTDIADVLIYFIEHNSCYKNYNLCSGKRTQITTIAEEICRQMGVDATIVCQKDGFNLEYTGSNDRLFAEMPEWSPTTMKDSIANILRLEGII